MAKPTDIIPLQVRMPEALRRKLAKAAEENERSLNGEIIWRLQRSFGSILDLPIEEVEEQFAIQRLIDKALDERGIGKGKK
jgi:hypothetical protein